MKKNKTLQISLLLIVGLSSCVSHKELLYLSDVPVDADITDTISNFGQTDLRIQPDDMLAITVSSYNIEASKPFNLEPTTMLSMATMGGGAAAGGGEAMTGYFVDQEGFIDFPILGRLDVNQKTLNQTKAILYEKLKAYLKDPVVNIRFLNLKISVLGEVLRPGTIRLTNKRVTIFEAIGLAGDMTPYSNRSNVLLIRERNGKRSIKRINLQSSKVFKSPYYYLQQNDVVIVDPNKTKANTVADQTSRWVGFVTAGASILTVLTLLLRKP
jgi:polysaccharide biosynthesis/export protein